MKAVKQNKTVSKEYNLKPYLYAVKLAVLVLLVFAVGVLASRSIYKSSDSPGYMGINTFNKQISTICKDSKNSDCRKQVIQLMKSTGRVYAKDTQCQYDQSDSWGCDRVSHFVKSL